MADATNNIGKDKPLQDVASSGYAGSGDRIQLIDDDHYVQAETELPVSNGQQPGPRSEISPLQMEDTGGLHSKRKTQEGLKIVIVSSVSFSVSVTVALVLTIILGPPAMPPHGAVACDDQRCSDIGVTILKDGGSAVDAAIAAVLCMGVVSSHHSGIGGGAFALVRRHKENTSTVIDAREVAPTAASDALYTNPDDLRTGRLSVAVPGELKGLQDAYDQFGRLPWKELVAPAANLARNGFAVSGNLAYAIATHIDPNDAGDAALREIFYNDTQPVLEGDTLKLPKLAAVLDDLAAHGADIFYNGKYAEEISTATIDFVTLDDLANYKTTTGPTLKKSFRNTTIETMPAPGGGPLVLFILHVLQNYTLSNANQTDPLYYHRMVEAIKFMFGEKYKFADPAFVEDMDNITELVTSLEYAASIRTQINDNTTQDSSVYLKAATISPSAGTAHVSVIGPDEDMVAITTTINQYFGSHVVTSSGIILNNEMYDFDLPTPGEPSNSNNNIEGGKRPLSSMSPSIVHRFGKPCASRIAIGGINGTEIIPGVAQVLMNILAFGKNITQAVETPRLSNPLVPNQLEFESNFNTTILTALSGLGHVPQVEDSRGISFIHAIAKINETVMAHGDTREQGSGSSIF